MNVIHRIIITGLISGVALAATGCQKRGSAEKFGKTYYLDGAGNWGFGASQVPNGLKRAGYVGDVELYVWTSSFNPLIDQLNIGNARLRAAILSDKINRYKQRYPTTWSTSSRCPPGRAWPPGRLRISKTE
jgi:hypothetical protein